MEIWDKISDDIHFYFPSSQFDTTFSVKKGLIISSLSVTVKVAVPLPVTSEQASVTNSQFATSSQTSKLPGKKI